MKKTETILLFCCLSLLFFAGCGGDGLGRVPVGGKVTIGSEPVKTGNIVFEPKVGTNCPVVGGEIKDGAYNLPKKDGPVPGEFQVKIYASGPTGKKIVAPYSGQETDEIASIVPPKYDPITGSEKLSASIKPGKNEIDFNIPTE